MSLTPVIKPCPDFHQFHDTYDYLSTVTTKFIAGVNDTSDETLE
jgi:hypothetical protein